MEVKIGVSNRHVHLTKEVYDMLFDEKIEKDYDLSQPGQFASRQRVTIIAGDKEIANVRVLGPFRDYNQVEISHKDALNLGINPPVRRSGDLSDALEVILKTPKASVKVKGCIISQRHLHISKEEANNLNLKDKDIVQIKIDGDKSGVMDAYVKVMDTDFTEVHIDTDDANAFLINNDHNKGTLL